MEFKNVTSNIKDSFISYQCDLVELNAIYNGESGFDKHDLIHLYSRKKEQYLYDLFSVLSERLERFGEEVYPFELNYDELSIRVRSKHTERSQLYLFLLICSMHDKIKQQKGNELESAFEYLSTLLLRDFMPSHAQVHHFGSSSYQQDRYKGSLSQKIDTLADDIGCDACYDPDEIPLTNRGDGGLDVVAWIPFPSDAFLGKIPIFLGQCTIGRQDWIRKQADVNRMMTNIVFPRSLTNMMFVPHCLRKVDGSMYKKDIYADTIFDRFRFISLLSGKHLVEFSETKIFEELVALVKIYSNNILD
ncbi:hypothetical protein NMR85_002009 [Vibrio alginolyticus]|nr:hypothetical protein [Vibrio alginolyticus]